MKQPKFTLLPEGGVIRHIFEVDLQIAQRIAEQYKLKISPEQRSSFFGTVGQDGCIHIWEVGAFCRFILSMPTGLENCSWAAVQILNGELRFLLYSRRLGLFVSPAPAEEATIGDFPFIPILIPGRQNAGFCQPTYHSSQEVKLINADDNLVRVDLVSKSLLVMELKGMTHLTFLIGLEKYVNLIIIGSENGKVSLVDLSNPVPSVLDEIDFLHNELIEGAKKKCNIPTDENMAIPLCCAGDEISGNYLIGTRANVLVQVILQVSNQKSSTISIVKCKGIPSAGVNSIVLYPTKDKVLVSGWDSVLRVFSFPSMDFILSFEWTSYPRISVMSFVENKRTDPTSEYVILASESKALSLWPVDEHAWSICSTTPNQQWLLTKAWNDCLHRAPVKMYRNLRTCWIKLPKLNTSICTPNLRLLHNVATKPKDDNAGLDCITPTNSTHLTPNKALQERFNDVEITNFAYHPISSHPLKLLTTVNPAVLVKEKLKLIELPKYYLSLSKFRLSTLVMTTSIAGYMMAPGVFDGSVLLCAAAGTLLLSAGANTVNQIVEVPYDSEMIRTKGRVLVRELLSTPHAVGFALTTTAAGLLILTYGANPLTAVLGATNLFLYTSVYTPLKRQSILNTWVGSVVGALPPLMGWAAAEGTLSPGGFLLAGILFSWQFVHFNSLSWNLRADYKRAGYRMMSVTHPDLCVRTCLRYASSLVVLSTLAPVLGVTSWFFAIDSLPFNLWAVYLAYNFYQKKDSASSRKLFRYSLVHLPIIIILMIISKTRQENELAIVPEILP